MAKNYTKSLIAILVGVAILALVALVSAHPGKQGGTIPAEAQRANAVCIDYSAYCAVN